MAKNIYNNETFLRGKVGKNIYKVVRGKQIVAPFAIPANPRTTAQILVRAKMALIGRVAAFMKSILKLGFGPYAKQRRSLPAALFIKENYKHIDGLTPATLIMKWDELVVSKGSNRGIVLDTDHIDQTSVPGTISVAVQEQLIEADRSNIDDKCYLVALCPEVNDACVGAMVKRQEANELSVIPPAWWSGKKVYLYAVTTNEDGTIASDSLMVGKIDFVIE